MAFKVDEDGPVCPTSAQGKVIDRKDTGGTGSRNRKGPETAKKGVSADWRAGVAEQARSGLTAEREGNLREPVGQTDGPPGVGLNHARETLGEDAALAGVIATEEPPGVEAKLHRQAAPREIGERAVVATVYALRHLIAERAPGCNRSGTDVDGDG
jgi:hypothetical protein